MLMIMARIKLIVGSFSLKCNLLANINDTFLERLSVCPHLITTVLPQRNVIQCRTKLEFAYELLQWLHYFLDSCTYALKSCVFVVWKIQNLCLFISDCFLLKCCFSVAYDITGFLFCFILFWDAVVLKLCQNLRVAVKAGAIVPICVILFYSDRFISCF